MKLQRRTRLGVLQFDIRGIWSVLREKPPKLKDLECRSLEYPKKHPFRSSPIQNSGDLEHVEGETYESLICGASESQRSI
jgi:hypothetical protein